MTEAVYESCPVAEDSWEFMKRKREEYEDVADEEEEKEEVADEDDEESDVESCKFSEYEDIQELSDDSLPDDVSDEYREYCKQEHLSEGFNVPSPPPKEAIGCICEIYEGEVWWPYAEEGAEIAVDHYNDNRAPPDGKLRFVRLETVNIAAVAGLLFYLTFEAENVTSKEKKMYQSKLYRRIDAYWQVMLFRKMPLKTEDATVSSFDEAFQKLRAEAPHHKANFILFLADKEPSTNLSWCPDCVRAEPVIYKKLESSPDDIALLKAYVGDRPTWRTPAHPWRVDPRFMLTGVPTLIRWENDAVKGRLEDHEAHLEHKINALLS